MTTPSLSELEQTVNKQGIFDLDETYALFNASTTSQKSKVCKKIILAVDETFKALLRANHSTFILLLTTPGRKIPIYLKELNVVKIGELSIFNSPMKKKVWFLNHITQDNKNPLYNIVERGQKIPNRQITYSSIMLTTNFRTYIERELQSGIIENYLQDRHQKMIEHAKFRIKQDHPTLWEKVENTMTEQDWEEEIAHGLDFTDTPLNRRSLENYINDPQTQNFPKNLQIAKNIHLIASEHEAVTGNFALRQAHACTNSARTYFSGINLQSCPKIVRQAALGKCFQYDLNAAAQATAIANVHRIIRANGIPNHTDTVKNSFPRTLEYIRYKKEVREQLRQQVCGQAKNDFQKNAQMSEIKGVLTAIGFGAELTGVDPARAQMINNAICGVFSYQDETGAQMFNRQRINAVMSNTWIQKFAAEQKLIKSIVVEDWKEKNKDASPKDAQYSHLVVSDKRKVWDENKIMSHIFQESEQDLIADLYKWLEERNARAFKEHQVNVLLQVHDAIYTDRRLPVDEMNGLLSKYNPRGLGINLFSISQEEHTTWANRSTEAESEHILRIRTEERKARNSKVEFNWLTSIDPHQPSELELFFHTEIETQAQEAMAREYNRQLTSYDPEWDEE